MPFVRTLVYAAGGGGVSITALFRPYLGLLCLAVLYFFRPSIYGDEQYVKPVLWITITTAVGWLALKRRSSALEGTRWLIMFLGMYAIATLFAPFRTSASWSQVILQAKILFAVFLIIKLCSSPERLAGFVAAMVAGSLWLVKVALMTWHFYGFSGDIRVDVATGQGGDANYMAWILAALMPFVLYKIVRGRSWQRIGAICIAPLYLISIIATGSRGGLLCLIASCGMFLLLLRQFKLILVLVLLGVMFLMIAPGAYFERMETITLDPEKMDASMLSRYQNTKAAIEIAKDYPVFGAGLGAYPNIKSRYLPEDYVGSEKHVIHNTYLQMAAEVGMPFLVVFCLFTVWIVRRSLPPTKSGFDAEATDHLEWIRIGTLSALAAVWVQMVKGDIAHIDLFWWFYGILVCVHLIRLKAPQLETKAKSLPQSTRARRAPNRPRTATVSRSR